MDHSEAVNRHAVERYLLGQMPDSEDESFERHFFDCQACTRELESGALLEENARAAFAGEGVRPPEAVVSKLGRLRELWRLPLAAAPALACATLAAFVVYQSAIVIPTLQRQIAQSNTPQALVTFTIQSASRGDEERVVIPAGSRYFLINVDLAGTSFSKYHCDVYSESGAVQFSVDSPVPPPGNPLSILIPARSLRPGIYTLRIRGIGGATAEPEIGRYSFRLQLR